MSVTQKPNGMPLYFYTNEVRSKSQVAAVKANNQILTRKQRRKLERKLKRLGVNKDSI